MKMKNYQKLRLNEFNEFDLERIMKDNIEILGEENDNALALISDVNTNMSVETIDNFINMIDDFAGESVYILSMLHHADDIYVYFTNGPLFRKDRDA